MDLRSIVRIYYFDSSYYTFRWSLRELYHCNLKGSQKMSLYQLCERFQEPLDASIFRSFKAKIDDTKRKCIEANIKNRTKGVRVLGC